MRGAKVDSTSAPRFPAPCRGQQQSGETEFRFTPTPNVAMLPSSRRIRARSYDSKTLVAAVQLSMSVRLGEIVPSISDLKNSDVCLGAWTGVVAYASKSQPDLFQRKKKRVSSVLALRVICLFSSTG